MKTVFFGSSRFVIPVIEILNKHFDLAVVVTTEKRNIDPIPSYCKSKNIKFFSVTKFDDPLIKGLKQIHSPAAVLASFGVILRNEVLEVFPQGILNIHPSLLPIYRGATPVQSAIISGDKETGVTIIKLDEEMDHGKILAQEKVMIRSNDTSESLMDTLFRKGATIVADKLPKYVSGDIKLYEQNHNAATYTKRLLKREDGFIDLENYPPKDLLERLIRAYYPWPGVWTKVRIAKKEVRIKFLPDRKIQVEGNKPMNYKDFLNGYPQLKEKFGKIIG